MFCYKDGLSGAAALQFFVCFVFKTVFSCNPVYPRTLSVDQDGFELRGLPRVCDATAGLLHSSYGNSLLGTLEASLEHAQRSVPELGILEVLGK